MNFKVSEGEANEELYEFENYEGSGLSNFFKRSIKNIY